MFTESNEFTQRHFETPPVREAVKTITGNECLDNLEQLTEGGKVQKYYRDKKPSPVCSKCFTRNGFAGYTVNEQFVCDDCADDNIRRTLKKEFGA